MEKKIYAIGLGPGDHELITLKAKRLLDEANAIFLSGCQAFNGFEGVKAFLEKIGCANKLIFIEMPTNSDNTARNDHITYFVDETIKFFNEGKKVVYVTMGDISIYSSYPDVYIELKKRGIILEGVNGIPSFLTPTALTGLAIAEWQEKAAIMPCPKDYKDIENMLKVCENVLIMKTNDKGEVLREFIKHNKPSKAVSVFYAYNENQTIYDLLKDFPSRDDFYMSVTLIKK